MGMKVIKVVGIKARGADGVDMNCFIMDGSSVESNPCLKSDVDAYLTREGYKLGVREESTRIETLTSLSGEQTGIRLEVATTVYVEIWSKEVKS